MKGELAQRLEQTWVEMPQSEVHSRQLGHQLAEGLRHWQEMLPPLPHVAHPPAIALPGQC